MKRFFLFLFAVIALSSFAQVPSKPSQQSNIDIKGSGNVIKVIQGESVVVYNLNLNSDLDRFTKYLQTIPGMQKNIKKIIEQNDKIIEKVNQLSEGNTFDIRKFSEEIARYVLENDRLKKENERLLKQTSDMDFASTLRRANEKLENYDNKGYQKEFENYKNLIKNRRVQEQKEMATASFLQAQNNLNSNLLDSALVRINEAIEYDKETLTYLFFKAQIQYEQRNYESALHNFIQVLTVQENFLGKENGETWICYKAIGLTYRQMGDYKNALSFLDRALSILSNTPMFEKSKDDLCFGLCLTYLLSGKESLGLEYLNKCSFNTETKILGILNYNLNYYSSLKDSKKITLCSFALSYLTQNNTTQSDNLLQMVYVQLAISYCNEGNKPKADDFFAEAVKLSVTLKEKGLRLDNLNSFLKDCKSQ